MCVVLLLLVLWTAGCALLFMNATYYIHVCSVDIGHCNVVNPVTLCHYHLEALSPSAYQAERKLPSSHLIWCDVEKPFASASFIRSRPPQALVFSGTERPLRISKTDAEHRPPNLNIYNSRHLKDLIMPMITWSSLQSGSTCDLLTRSRKAFHCPNNCGIKRKTDKHRSNSASTST